MIVEQSKKIIAEVNKAFIGKNDIIEKVLMTIYAGGHVLLEDCPGVGKTTLAVAFSKALGLSNKRIQFTPDTLPSDITGFTMYNRETNQFEYREGAANCQLLLADEINRTSPKTQSALLEVMEEHSITVDGVTHMLPSPFICIATQNPLGSAGTQPLPESQLDRFMIKLSMGYPDPASEIAILKDRQGANPLNDVKRVVDAGDIVAMQEETDNLHMDDAIIEYITMLSSATRQNPLIELGVSPRGTIALAGMSKAKAYISGRTYVTPDDVQSVFKDVAGHRIILNPSAKISSVTIDEVIDNIFRTVPVPRVMR